MVVYIRGKHQNKHYCEKNALQMGCTGPIHLLNAINAPSTRCPTPLSYPAAPPLPERRPTVVLTPQAHHAVSLPVVSAPAGRWRRG